MSESEEDQPRMSDYYNRLGPIPEDHFENDCAPNPNTEKMTSTEAEKSFNELIERLKAVRAKPGILEEPT